jgi:hypothetical protein
MVPLRVQSIAADGTVSFTRTSGFDCQTIFSPDYSSFTPQLLSSGDLYTFHASPDMMRSTGSLWSSAACAWNFTPPRLQSTGTFCGTLADGSQLSMVLEPVQQTLTAVLQLKTTTTACAGIAALSTCAPRSLPSHR